MLTHRQIRKTMFEYLQSYSSVLRNINLIYCAGKKKLEATNLMLHNFFFFLVAFCWVKINQEQKITFRRYIPGYIKIQGYRNELCESNIFRTLSIS